MQTPASRSSERLLDPPRPQVEQVEEVRRQQQQREVGEVAGPLAAEPGDREGGEAEGAGGLDRPGRQAAREHRAGMAAPAARACRPAWPRPSMSSSRPRSAIAEQIGGPAVEPGLEQVEVGAVVEHRERRQRDHRDGDRAARRCGKATVRPRQFSRVRPVPSMSAVQARQQPDRQQPPRRRGRRSSRRGRPRGRSRAGRLVGLLLDPEVALERRRARRRGRSARPAGRGGRPSRSRRR